RGQPSPDRRRRIGMTLRLLRDGQVRIEVADHDPGLPVQPDTDPESESGRGLQLIEALSKEWGVTPLSCGGKVVYVVIDARVGETTQGGLAERGSGSEMPWRAQVLGVLATFPNGTTVSRLIRPLADGKRDYDSVYNRTYRELRRCEGDGYVRRTSYREQRVE